MSSTPPHQHNPALVTPSSTPSLFDHSSMSSSSQDQNNLTPRIPQPLKILPTSFRRSISAPFTTSGLISLEFPSNIRLDSITEDAISFQPAQPTPTFQLFNSIPSSIPLAPSHLSPSGLPFDTYPIPNTPDPSASSDLNLPPPPPPPPHPLPPHADQYKKWASNFYVWVYDPPAPSDPPPPPSPTSALNSSTASNLSNNLIGGISKHFFNNSFRPSNLPPTKSFATKKDRRVKGLISGLTKQKDSSSQLDSPTVSTFDKQSIDPHSISAPEQQLDSFSDKSEIDPLDISKVNQSRFSSNSKTHELQYKPKRNSANAEPNKLGRKRFVPGFGGGGGGGGSGGTSSSSGSITSQLALGPGPAMNSQGVGAGQWKLVQGVITEDGHFTLYTTEDVVLYRIHLPSYRRTDIRMVHQSIFGRLHCGVITRRTVIPVPSNNLQNSPPLYNSTASLPLHSSSSLPLTPASGSPSLQATSSATTLPALNHSTSPLPQHLSETTMNSSKSSSMAPNPTHPQMSSNSSPDVSIYVCMPSLVLLESWLVICKCFCRPDDFRHLYPRHNKKNQATGQRGARGKIQSLTGSQPASPLLEQPPSPNPGGGASLKGSIKQGLPERVRIWRGVEIRLLEGRKLGEYQQIMINNMVAIGNEDKVMMKEERRNSTGAYLPTSSQASLLSINKELLFNKSSNIAKHQTAQQFVINDPSYQNQQQDHHSLQYRYKSKNIDEYNGIIPGFSTSSTPALNLQGGQMNRPSLPTPASAKPDLYHHGDSTAPLLTNAVKSSSSTTFIFPSLPNEPSSGSSKYNSNPTLNDNFYFVEFDWDKEIIGRSTIKRNSNPFWREEFKFSEIGSFKTSMVLNVYQIKKSYNPPSKSSPSPNSLSSYSSKIQLIGQTHLDFKKFEKNLPLQLWLPVYSSNNNNNHNNSDDNEIGDENLNNFDTTGKNNSSIYKKVNIVGEINLSITVFEQVVLAELEYSKMLSILNNDNDVEVALNLANIALGELDRLAELLIRIYESSDRLILRLSQLAAIEISGDLSTASILFRANTLLTKMLEAYMRMVGGSFLELSIGSVIRRICTGKVELEIDPSKLKPTISSSQREKIINENAKELNKISNEIWQSMYIHRSKCPNRLRKIFVKIQEFVGNAYDDQDMRLTSISAFIFLRFFVPAILNPRLFNLIQFQPDSKSQRTLTLLAKTLQGLGNLTLFGIKEPWMSVMNEFITTQLDSFRDYISFISRESDSTKPEWTSKEYEGYGLPYALRASLPASSRDGIPTLPHLLDPVKDCALLANLIVCAQRKTSDSDYLTPNPSVLSLKTNKLIDHPNLTNRARRKNEVPEKKPNLAMVDDDGTANNNFNDNENNQNSATLEFLKLCDELHAKSERRCVKIIQSELKNSNNANNKPPSLTNTTTTTPSTTAAATNPTNTTLITSLNAPINLKKPTPESLPQTVINSRKFIVHNAYNHLLPPGPISTTAVTLTPPPNRPSSPSSITRWKRSHTVSTEHTNNHLYNNLSDISDSPRSPNLQYSLDTLGLHHHNQPSFTDLPIKSSDIHHFLPSASSSSSTTANSPFSPSHSSTVGIKINNDSGFVGLNRSPRSKTISSPNSFNSEYRDFRRGLLSQFESAPSNPTTTTDTTANTANLNNDDIDQFTFKQDNSKILSGENVQVSNNTAIEQTQSVHLIDRDHQSPIPTFINSWQPNQLCFIDQNQSHADVNNHNYSKIRSLSRKSGFKLSGTNHFAKDFQSTPQQHRVRDQEEKKEKNNSIYEDNDKIISSLRSQKKNDNNLGKKKEKNSKSNSSNFKKGHRSSSSLSLSSLVSVSSSSSFSSVTHNLRRNFKFDLNFHNNKQEPSDSKNTSPILTNTMMTTAKTEDGLNYTSPIGSNGIAHLNHRISLPHYHHHDQLKSSISSFIPQSPPDDDDDDSQFLLLSPKKNHYQKLPSSSGSNTITILHEPQQQKPSPPPPLPLRPSSSHKNMHYQGDSQMYYSNYNNDEHHMCTTNTTNSGFATSTAVPQDHLHHSHSLQGNTIDSNDGYNCSNNNSSTSNTNHILSSSTSTIATLPSSSMNSHSNSNTGHQVGNSQRKGFIKKIMRKNSVAR